MMEVTFSSSFKRSFRKKSKGVMNFEKMFWEHLSFFIENPFNPRLKTHKLSGKLEDLWSFSIGFNYRVVFYFTDENPRKAVLVDIGTHDEVY